MTNEHRVRELCRAIRGIAMQYPTGLDAIALEVAVQMKATGRRGQSVSGATQVADEAGAQLSGRVAPEQNTQGKRRPGRPRKVQG